ncbi:MAG: hypothetical protein KC944_21620 [Candidatus Omnitrophica bacterium]|nr:hypothetical protein [Candidatus Omnitrophota bacterium]
MTSENRYEENGTDRGYYLIGGIYRVVKSIDDKMDTFIEEMRDWAETREESDWYGKNISGFLE